MRCSSSPELGDKLDVLSYWLRYCTKEELLIYGLVAIRSTLSSFCSCGLLRGTALGLELVVRWCRNTSSSSLSHVSSFFLLCTGRIFLQAHMTFFSACWLLAVTFRLLKGKPQRKTCLILRSQGCHIENVYMCELSEHGLSDYQV